MSGGASLGTKSSRPILGFPEDLPDDLIATVNDLAARDARGEPVPGLVAHYNGVGGRRTADAVRLVAGGGARPSAGPARFGRRGRGGA